MISAVTSSRPPTAFLRNFQLSGKILSSILWKPYRCSTPMRRGPVISYESAMSSRSLTVSNVRSESGVEDPELRLMVPSNDIADPELSIVVPALNEQITIGEFVDWCQQGLDRAQVRGEILILDSSSDATADIALARGARVLKSAERGLGRAYVDGLPFIRGEYVLMGDADCTYDFRSLEPFMQSFHKAYDHVMRSHIRDYSEQRSTTPLPQYPVSPATTWL